MRWMRRIFVRNAVIVLSSEKNFHRISPHFLQIFTAKITKFLRENSPHRLLWQINVRKAVKALNAVKKISPKFTAFLTKIYREIHRISCKISPHLLFNVYWIWFKFTRSLIAVSDSWRSGIRNWRPAWGKGFEYMKGSSFFVRMLRTRWKQIIHSDSPHSLQNDASNSR